MHTFTQIVLGSGLLMVSIVAQAAIFIVVYNQLRARHPDGHPEAPRSKLMVLIWALAGILFAHTLHVWALAFALVAIDALPHLSEALYFSLSTYTTVGYGDIVLDPGVRTFGAFGAVTGLLAFGLSTAFLAGLVSRLLPHWDGGGHI
ncbi:MAG: potassium channel family protein [Pseudomonadota bacterium]